VRLAGQRVPGQALQILDDQIADRVSRPVHVLLSSELVVRGSA